LSESFDWGFAEGDDVLIGLGTAEDGNEGNKQNLAEGIVARPGVQIVEVVEGAKEMNGDTGNFTLVGVLLDDIRCLWPVRIVALGHKTLLVE
jgi:hypothetical protein